MSSSVIEINIPNNTFASTDTTFSTSIYDIYNVRIIQDNFSIYNGINQLFMISANVIYFFLICFLYLFVALEEVDYQILGSSKDDQELNIENDEWSLWKLLN